jgi:hypothetical protein
VKAALASIAFLALMLLVILVGSGEGSGTLFLLAVLYSGVLSFAFALVALGGAVLGRQPGRERRLTIVVIALPVLLTFVVAIVAIARSFDAAFD